METQRQKSQQDPLEQLRHEWEQLYIRASELPSLTDEELKRIYDTCSSSQVKGSLLPTRRLRLVWAQVLPAAVCLCAGVWSMVLCGRMGDDRIMRIMLYVIAAGSLLLATHCIYPPSSPLFRRYRSECGIGTSPKASFGLGMMLPVGLAFMVVLLLASQMPVGDGYHIMALRGDRLAILGSVECQLMYQA